MPYHFDESRSTDTEYVFVRTEIPGKLQQAAQDVS